MESIRSNAVNTNGGRFEFGSARLGVGSVYGQDIGRDLILEVGCHER